MTPEINVLIVTAASIAFAHTLLGPDHYLPFVAMAKARKWSLSKTLRITLYCGVGHLVGSVLLGLLGIFLGVQLSSLTWLEGLRGNLAAWLLIGIGLAYTAWGIRHALRMQTHTHWHQHDHLVHKHAHNHSSSHAHLHRNPEKAASLTPWMIFIFFILGPCEPLIPLLMYPAAKESLSGVLAVTLVFGLVTVLTMILAVSAALMGLKTIPTRRLEPYGHAIAGSTLLFCGLGIVLLGL